MDIIGDNLPPPVTCALMSLASAKKRLGAIAPLACVSFVCAWWTDLDVLRHVKSDVATVGDLTGSAKVLYLPALDSCLNQWSRRS
jgi:hypothetical protein